MGTLWVWGGRWDAWWFLFRIIFIYDNNIVNRVYIGDGARVLFRVSWCCACIIVCSTNRNPQSRLNIVVV